jgi:protein-disulfide isomerase
MQENGVSQRKTTFAWRSVLDVVTSVVLIGAAMIVVTNYLSRPQRPGPRVPSEPISIDSAATKGSSTAPVVMIAFADFQCPYCGRFTRDVLPALERDYITSGQVQYVYRHLPLSNHQYAVPAAHAAECAGASGQFWPMHDRLFATGAQLK